MAEATPLYQTYNRAPLRFERGEGVWLVTETGERYLDFAAGVAVTSVVEHPATVQPLALLNGWTVHRLPVNRDGRVSAADTPSGPVGIDDGGGGFVAVVLFALGSLVVQPAGIDASFEILGLAGQGLRRIVLGPAGVILARFRRGRGNEHRKCHGNGLECGKFRP